jgi:hypothetical protein
MPLGSLPATNADLVESAYQVLCGLVVILVTCLTPLGGRVLMSDVQLSGSTNSKDGNAAVCGLRAWVNITPNDVAGCRSLRVARV